MKSVTPALATLINSLPTGGQFQYAHCYTFALAQAQGGVPTTQALRPAVDAGILSAWAAHESMTPLVVGKRGTPVAAALAAAGRPIITTVRGGEAARGLGGAGL